MLTVGGLNLYSFPMPTPPANLFAVPAVVPPMVLFDPPMITTKPPETKLSAAPIPKLLPMMVLPELLTI
jgi:hypothetical protein